MIYKTYLDKAALDHKLLFNGSIKTLGYVLKTNKEYFSKKPFSLLGINSSTKIEKGKKIDINTAILYLAPDTTVTGRRKSSKSKTLFTNKTICPNASRNGCSKDCLATSGRLGMINGQLAQIRRTLYYLYHNESFMIQLQSEIDKYHKKYGDSLAVRLNGTSDLNWSKLIARNPGIQFYDYSKLRNMIVRNKNKNHHYTFSGSMYSDYSRKELKKAVDAGLNIALAFNTKGTKKDTLRIPKKLFNKKLIDFDITDVRFKDKKGSIGFLKRKGSNVNERLTDNKKVNNFFITESNIKELI